MRDFRLRAHWADSSGSFTFGLPLTLLYNQFAIAVKDGGRPKFAIFELPVGTFTQVTGRLRTAKVAESPLRVLWAFGAAR